jgi:hypothetical protein
VGVPTAEALNDIADKSRRAKHGGKPVLVYDNIGIRDTWIAHLKWLDENIEAVRTLKLSEAASALADWKG